MIPPDAEEMEVWSSGGHEESQDSQYEVGTFSKLPSHSQQLSLEPGYGDSLSRIGGWSLGSVICTVGLQE